MTFKKLQKTIEKELGIIKLADIAREFNVSPQVINNWKARDQVPYKYVKTFKEKIKEKQFKSEKTPNFFFQSTQPFEANNDSDESSFSDYFFIFLKYFIEYKKLIFATLILSIVFGKIYLRFFVVPLYMTEATILPINKGVSNGGMSAIAGQFGVSLGDNKSKVDLSSGHLVPEIVKSRKLAKSLLDYDFDTKKFGKNKKLISIVKNDTVSKIFSEHQIRGAAKRVRRMISVKVQKRSPILILRVQGSDKFFIPKLLDAVINELSDIVSQFKLSQNLEKKSYIGSRMNDVMNSLEVAENKYKNFKQTNRKILQSPSLIIEEQRLLREIELQTKIYITLKTEYQMAEIEEVGNSSIIQILDEPEIPTKKLSPKPAQIYLSFIIFGIISCTGIVLFREWYLVNVENLKRLILK